MNVYDFDGTIYNGDSTFDFVKWCCRRHPKALLTLPLTGIAFGLYILGVFSKTKFKEKMYRFLKYVPDVDNELELFWEQHQKKIKKWYADAHKDDDYVASASPEFLLKPICKELGIQNLSASIVDKNTGKYTGENCWGEEKTKRLSKKFPDIKVKRFYSDSLSDEPLARLAEEAYIVSGERLIAWEEYKPPKYKMFLTREFMTFLVVGVLNTFAGSAFALLYRKLIPNDTVAFVPGWLSGNILSYFLNSIFTFRDMKFGVVKYLRFMVSNLPNLIIQTVMVQIFSGFLHLPSILVYAMAAVIGVPVTFVFVKLFAFAKKDNERK